jgi:hypothetical protein
VSIVPVRRRIPEEAMPSPGLVCRLSTLLFAALCAGSPAVSQEWKSGIEWPEPPVVKPGTRTKPPGDAIVLFDGTNLDAWDGVENWTIEEGVATVGSTVTSKQKFGDCQLHLEFATPAVIEGKGQGRGNSGVYLMGKYELQILDSYENETYFDGQCAAVYKQRPPLVNASRKPGRWQTYDIIFTAPRFHEDGTVKTPAYITALHNGVLVQNHLELQGSTFFHKPPEYERHGDREPLTLQYHNNPTRFRNIWIRDLQLQK